MSKSGRCRPLRIIVSMSLQLAIPWRVALQQSSPPLCQPISLCNLGSRLRNAFQRTVTLPRHRVSTEGYSLLPPAHSGGWLGRVAFIPANPRCIDRSVAARNVVALFFGISDADHIITG